MSPRETFPARKIKKRSFVFTLILAVTVNYMQLRLLDVERTLIPYYYFTSKGQRTMFRSTGTYKK